MVKMVVWVKGTAFVDFGVFPCFGSKVAFLEICENSYVEQ